MLLATVWRRAAICELYRDETSLWWSHDASTDEAYPPRARSGGFRILVCALITVGLPALTSARERVSERAGRRPRHYRVGRFSIASAEDGQTPASHDAPLRWLSTDTVF